MVNASRDCQCALYAWLPSVARICAALVIPLMVGTTLVILLLVGTALVIRLLVGTALVIRLLVGAALVILLLVGAVLDATGNFRGELLVARRSCAPHRWERHSGESPVAHWS